MGGAVVKIGQKGKIGSQGDLAGRVEQLEREVQEGRQLNVRLASVIDLVDELLLVLADNDDPRTAEALERYRASVGEVGGRR